MVNRKKNGYQLVYIDVDGTLVTSHREVTPRTRHAVERAQAAGLSVALATGRTYESALPYSQALRANAPLILCNGARLQLPATGEVLREWRLLSGIAEAVVTHARAQGLHVSVFQDEAIYIAEWSATARESAEKDGVRFVPVGDLRQVLKRPPLKMMVIGESAQMDALRLELLSHFTETGCVPPALVRSEPTYLEVWNPDASKGTAMAVAAAGLGIPLSGIIAFGDGLNDTEMLRMAGLGVAMGNAHPELQALARQVTTSNDEDGVARVLEVLLDGEPA